MAGSHVAWVFVALLLGVCIGWLTYKRGRARFLDAIIWVVIGLVIAAPILLPDLPAAATPLGTLLALFYFVGCPIGWSWRHGAIVEHRCAETDARGYVYRGAAAPPRWQAVSQQDSRTIPIAGAAKMEAASVPHTAPPPTVPTTATAHAVPSDGKESSPSTAAATGANAGVATAPASIVSAPAVARTPSPPPATSDEAQTGSNPSVSPSPSAHGFAIGTADASLPADGPADAAGGPAPSASPDPIASESTPSHADVPATAPPATVATDETRTPAPEPTQVQTAQTSLGLVPTSSANVAAGKVELQTTPVSFPESNPPAPAVAAENQHAGVVTTREDKPDDVQLIQGIAAGPADAVGGLAPSTSPGPIASESTPSPANAPAPARPSTSADEAQTSTPKPAPGQTAQTSLDFAPAPTADIVADKVEPQTTPVGAPASDPPASAPVPDQDKHAGVRPPGFVTAREDKPDDLHLIRGIGPQNEGRLHGLGIWHFDQIGAWTAEEVRWVGSYLAFPGRIDREKWVDQAREIASGAIIPKAAARRPTRPR